MITIAVIVVLAFIVFVIYKSRKTVKKPTFKEHHIEPEWSTFLQQSRTVLFSNISESKKQLYLKQHSAKIEKYLKDEAFRKEWEKIIW